MAAVGEGAQNRSILIVKCKWLLLEKGTRIGAFRLWSVHGCC